MKKLLVSMAIASVSAGAMAQEVNTAATNENFGGNALGVSAVAVVASCETIEAWKVVQGNDSCVGDTSASCAPNISSAELRFLLLDGVNRTPGNITGSGGDLATAASGQDRCANSTDITNTNAILFRDNVKTGDAVDQFMGEGRQIGAFFAGSANAAAFSGAARTSDADLIGNLNNSRIRMGTIHAHNLATADLTSIGFMKLDGSAPTLANLMSSNYNLVSNLHDVTGLPTTGEFAVYVAGDGNMDGDGVAYHNNGGNANASAPISTRAVVLESDGVGN